MKDIIEKLLHTYEGNVFISGLLGFGIATLFKPICVDCVKYISPDLRKQDGKRYKIDDNCYENKVVPAKCDGTELPSR